MLKVRPVLEYCTPVFNHSLPSYLGADLEWIQKHTVACLLCKNVLVLIALCHAISLLLSKRLHDQGLCKKLLEEVVAEKDINFSTFCNRGFIRSRDLGTSTHLRWVQYLPLLKRGLKFKSQTIYRGARLLYSKVSSTLKLNETPTYCHQSMPHMH